MPSLVLQYAATRKGGGLYAFFDFLLCVSDLLQNLAQGVLLLQSMRCRVASSGMLKLACVVLGLAEAQLFVLATP